ncbi:unnamed protein product [Caenorhabditis angaria]|uniref:Uncharacterized protein n=1 Tax=Caenorhabditis angaria TaxID=860376 RepID=A0A9P1J1C2_9PELO|nr:unnamed protein product [Caenorhabditis angaria]
MEILTVVIPDLIQFSRPRFLENSLFQQLEHVRKGTLPVAVGPNPVETMVDGISYCANVIQIPNNKQKKCSILFNQTEKVPLTSKVFNEVLGEDTVLTLGKTKDEKTFFIIVDRECTQVVLTEQITKLMDAMIRLTTNLKLRTLTEIERIRLPIELTGSFTLSITCGENGDRFIEIFDENMTQCGFVEGFVWLDTVV